VLKRLEDIRKPESPELVNSAEPVTPEASPLDKGDVSAPAPKPTGETTSSDDNAPTDDQTAPAAPPAPADDDDPAVRDLTSAQELIARADFAEAVRVLRIARTKHADSPHANEIRELLTQAMALRREAVDLGFALQNLGSGSSQAAAVARRQLIEAPDTAGILLCNALDGEGRLPIEAARLLGMMRYTKAVGLLQAKALDESGSAEWGDALFEALTYMLDEVDAAFLAELSLLVQRDPQFGRRREATLLARVYHRRASIDPAHYDAMLGLPGAAFVLGSYIESAMASRDEELSAWAHEQAARTGLYFVGLHGQYFAGMEFEERVHDQLDTRIAIPELQYPYPDGRSTNLSIRWTGFVVVPEPGTYKIYSASDDGQRVWLDNELVIDDWQMHGVQEMSASVRLDAGVCPIRVEHMQGEGPGTITVYWEGPGLERQVLSGKYLTTPPWAGARAAVPKVGADITVLQSLYHQQNSQMLETTVIRALKERFAELTPDFLTTLLASVRSDGDRERLTDAEILGTVFSRRCSLKAEAFDQLLGIPEAAEALKDYVSSARDSGQEELVKWADRQNVLRVHGLRGTYFEFEALQTVPVLEKVVFERLDGKIDIPDLGYGFKGGRTEYLGIRWTGMLIAPTEGAYTLYCTSDDGQRIWLDGKPLVDKWIMQSAAEYSATVKLTAGPHPFRLDYMQGMGDGMIKLEWAGPGIGRQVIPTESFQTPPWDGMGE